MVDARGSRDGEMGSCLIGIEFQHLSSGDWLHNNVNVLKVLDYTFLSG